MYNIANIITIHINTSISEIILETLQTIELGTEVQLASAQLGSRLIWFKVI